MSSISEVLKANEFYEKENQKLNDLCSKTRLINDNLNLEEVKNTLDYAKTKELYQAILYRINNKDKENELKKILQNKKIEEYPQLIDVHYYPVIKDINFLQDDEKINLDKILKDSFYEQRPSKEYNLSTLDSKILEFLTNNNIIEKQYIFHCTCTDKMCWDKIITQKEFDKYKSYWDKEMEGIETTAEEDEELKYGYFETGCWNGGNVEVGSLEAFNKHLRRVEYKIIQEPDMTLDNI